MPRSRRPFESAVRRARRSGAASGEHSAEVNGQPLGLYPTRGKAKAAAEKAAQKLNRDWERR